MRPESFLAVIEAFCLTFGIICQFGIMGVILFEETLYDKATDGETPLVDLLTSKGILPGIKVAVKLRSRRRRAHSRFTT